MKLFYFPYEIWLKIWSFTIIIDESHKKMLSAIRKQTLKKFIERKYITRWLLSYQWLHNDVYSWMNENMSNRFILAKRIKSIFKREFNLEVDDWRDVDAFENGKSSKKLWNIYAEILTEEELLEFKNDIEIRFMEALSDTFPSDWA